MARNSEKAHSMLFRFRAAQAAEQGILDISRTRRPKLITSITSIPTCEKWRGQVLKEISRKVSKIQDEALSDYQVRDLNDEINKLMREKWMWENQIRGLGGPNYMRGGRVLDEEGREVPGGGRGYKYFGRAKELPGVKELFERQKEPAQEAEGGRASEIKAREWARKVDASYYGYNLDEEDGTLVAYERAKEKEAWDNFENMPDEVEGLGVVVGGKGGKGDRGGVGDGGAVGGTAKSKKNGVAQRDWVELPGDAGDGVRWRVPTLEEVGEELVDRRKRKLLDQLG